MNLIGWLKARQNGETDEAFANRLGISPALWSLLQSGKRRPTLWLVRKAIATFPGDRSEILDLSVDAEPQDLAS